MTIYLDEEGPKAFLMIHGYVYTLRKYNIRPGFKIAYFHEDLNEGITTPALFFLCSVWVEKLFDVLSSSEIPSRSEGESPLQLAKYLKFSGGFETAEEWLEAAAVLYPFEVKFALFKITNMKKWQEEKFASYIHEKTKNKWNLFEEEKEEVKVEQTRKYSWQR